MIYPILKWLHILAAITAVGANITYGIWISRAARRPESLLFTLSSIKFIDDRVANPSFGLLLITGLLMVFTVRMPLLRTPWLLTALVLYGLLVLIGLFGFTPSLKRQLQILESQGPTSSEYQAVAGRGTVLGILLILLAVVIVFLMVVKPALWA